MRFLTGFCLIILSILLFSVNVLAVVYDDEGKVIDEEEIKKGMHEMHRTGVHPGRARVMSGFPAGCIVGASCWWGTAGNMFGDVQTSNALFLVGMASGIGIPFLGYSTGKELDERVAIERIKTKRRNRQQGYLDSESETLPTFQSTTTKAHSIDGWGSLGLGYSHAGAGPETDPGGGIAGRFSVCFQSNRVLITAYATANTGGDSHHKGFLGWTLRDEFFDAGLLIGYVISQREQRRIAPSIGIARVWGRRVVKDIDDHVPVLFGGPYEREPFAGLGVPVELSIILIENRFLGLGLIGHTNINAEEIFWGFTLNLLVGYFSK